jgi:hypothetical protein
VGRSMHLNTGGKKRKESDFYKNEKERLYLIYFINFQRNSLSPFLDLPKLMTYEKLRFMAFCYCYTFRGKYFCGYIGKYI